LHYKKFFKVLILIYFDSKDWFIFTIFPFPSLLPTSKPLITTASGINLGKPSHQHQRMITLTLSTAPETNSARMLSQIHLEKPKITSKPLGFRDYVN